MLLEISQNSQENTRPATLLKKRPWHRCFPVNFEKFLRTPFLQNTSGRLLLNFFLDLVKKLRINFLKQKKMYKRNSFKNINYFFPRGVIKIKFFNRCRSCCTCVVVPYMCRNCVAHVWHSCCKTK